MSGDLFGDLRRIVTMDRRSVDVPVDGVAGLARQHPVDLQALVNAPEPDADAVAACLRKNMKWISAACQAQFPENQKKKR